jgi:tetratricopeptide (TPR) repeat protein
LSPQCHYCCFPPRQDVQRRIAISALVAALRVKGLLEMRQERWQEAEACLKAALTAMRKIGMPYVEAKLLYAYGLLRTATGEIRQAYACFAHALALCQQVGERLYRPHIEQALTPLVA